SNSQVNLQMRLVYSGPTTYVESGNSTTDLFWLAGSPDASAAMSTYGGGAAKVCLLVGTDSSAGLAFNPGNYSVVIESAAVGVIAHEVGHNFGCRHDRV